jgi:hypothetical protein
MLLGYCNRCGGMSRISIDAAKDLIERRFNLFIFGSGGPGGRASECDSCSKMTRLDDSRKQTSEHVPSWDAADQSFSNRLVAICSIFAGLPTR